MSYEEQDVIWRVALASYDPREMRVWTRYLEERNPAIRCTGYRSSRPLLERLEQGDVDVLVLGGRLEDMDSIQFLPRIRGLARKPLVLLRDDGRNEKSAVDSALRRLLETLDETGTQTWRDFRKEYGLERRKVTIGRLLYALESRLSQQ